ncbi:hypothetical protein L833_0886 [Mycobacteroides abscessus MAB_091912_2446]|uniref:Uncharacterized protein n=1 Tax=Mycobacteroides abscessus MAB_091912_2446 TaxID=1335414 RepID=A0A829MGI5_9MYCO|nr:hypothetical protein L833_0886 [Mycobacteroides abscessus MAB_091912_2446]
MRGAHLQGSATPRFDQQSRARSGQPGERQAKTPGLHAQWRLTQSDSWTGDLEIYRCADRTRIGPADGGSEVDSGITGCCFPFSDSSAARGAASLPAPSGVLMSATVIHTSTVVCNVRRATAE